jgi:hypothetical protein
LLRWSRRNTEICEPVTRSQPEASNFNFQLPIGNDQFNGQCSVVSAAQRRYRLNRVGGGT